MVNEFHECNGLFYVPMSMPRSGPVKEIFRACPARSMNFKASEEWHRKLGHPHCDRFIQLMKQDNDIPDLDHASIRKYQCVPCLVPKAQRAHINRSS